MKPSVKMIKDIDKSDAIGPSSGTEPDTCDSISTKELSGGVKNPYADGF